MSIKYYCDRCEKEGTIKETKLQIAGYWEAETVVFLDKGLCSECSISLKKKVEEVARKFKVKLFTTVINKKKKILWYKKFRIV